VCKREKEKEARKLFTGLDMVTSLDDDDRRFIFIFRETSTGGISQPRQGGGAAVLCVCMCVYVCDGEKNYLTHKYMNEKL
jgi:hypothetical protein